MVDAINGACAGVGLLQACFCDVRFVSASAKITTAFARRGLCAEYGMAWILPRLMGVERALDLLLSGRTISGEEMVSMVSPLAPAHPTRRDRGRGGCRPPRRVVVAPSMAAIREQVWSSLDQEFAEAWDVSVEESVRFATYPDFAEGVASFRERRPPDSHRCEHIVLSSGHVDEAVLG